MCMHVCMHVCVCVCVCVCAVVSGCVITERAFRSVCTGTTDLWSV